MVEVNESLTRQAAHLARLELTNEEVQTFTRQLSDILQYVDQLQEADVTGVEPLVHPIDYETPLREDREIPSLRDEAGQPRVLDSAPDVLQESYKVPPIL